MRLAMVGIFFDGYSDMWEDFLILLRKYWTECPYDLYIVNQIKDVPYAKQYNVKIIHAGEDAEYSKKVLTAIDKIDADYYLILFEDYLFGKKISRYVLNSTLNFIEENKVIYYGFQLDLFFKEKTSDRRIQINKRAEYTMVSVYNIWEKGFLKKCIGKDNYNAWIFEGVYAKAPRVHTDEFLKGCYREINNPLCLYHGALQGKLLQSTIKHFKSEGYEFKTNREVLGNQAAIMHGLKVIAAKTLPLSIKRIMKTYFKSQSVTGKYDKEIDDEIHNLGLD